MFEFHDEINEAEEMRKRLRRRGRELTREEVNRMVDETAAKLELAPPQFGPSSDGLTNEEVNNLFDSTPTLGEFFPPEGHPQG